MMQHPKLVTSLLTFSNQDRTYSSFTRKLFFRAGLGPLSEESSASMDCIPS